MSKRKREKEEEKLKHEEENKKRKIEDDFIDDLENEKHDVRDENDKHEKKEQRVFRGPMRVNIQNIEDELFEQLQALIGTSILIVTESDQLNLFGQTFRPVFCGTIFRVSQGDVTLFPVNIKMINAPFFQFPTPLNIPLEKIAHFTPDFDCNQRIPLT
jgi:hypothetical protein